VDTLSVSPVSAALSDVLTNHLRLSFLFNTSSCSSHQREFYSFTERMTSDSYSRMLTAVALALL
jgi:hypothetical protein